MKEIVWDEKKNDLLKRTRGVSFEDFEYSIHNQKYILDMPHYNKDRYPNQRIFCIFFNEYIYCIPYEENEYQIRLITIFASRKFNKLLTDKNE